jgi:Tol biopolymer transport system component
VYKRIVTQLALIGCAVIFSLGVAQQHPQNVSAQTVTGTIAYVVGNDTTDQIWLIEPDESHNRKIYSIGVPDPYSVHMIAGLAWRPDAGELIFTSDHEDDCSWYNYDVYAILPDGNGYRRVTNGPACAALAGYPQGTVVVDTSIAPDGQQVYVQGAPGLKTVSGSTLTFDHVADFGNTLQPIVVINGRDRGLGLGVDVKAGQIVPGNAGPYTTLTDQLGAYSPVWRRDGSRVGYAFGCDELRGLPAHPAAGDYGQRLFDATGVNTCVMDWGPTIETANNILYFNNVGDTTAGIYRTTENGGIGTQVVAMPDLSMVFRIQYLPDASGFIYTFVNSSISSNVYRYDFQSDTITQLTDFSHEYARDFSISPDGQHIVFERAPEGLLCNFGCASDLWIMGIDGSNPHLLVAGGAHPTWSLRAIQMPTIHKLFLPLVKK